MTPTRVVAAVIERDGTFLLGRRPEEKRHGGLWEFPGGKMDEGETPTEAARRELAEELQLRVTDVGPLLHAVHDAGAPFVIEFYPVRADGHPVAHEHSELTWLAPRSLGSLALAPADRVFAEWLLASRGDQSSERR